MERGATDPAPPPTQGGGGIAAGLLTWVLVVVLYALGGGAMQLYGGEDPRWPIMASQLAFVLLPALLAGVWWARVWGEDPRSVLRVRAGGVLPTLLGASLPILLLPLLAGLLTLLEPWLPDTEMLERSLEQLLSAAGPGEAALVVAAAVLTPAVCEEVLFRGWLQGAFERETSPWFAVVLQAALFAALHIHPARMVPTFLLGLLLGWIARRSGSLLAPIMGHAAHNGLIVLQVSLAPAEEVVTPPETEATFVVLLVCAVLLAGAAWLFGAVTREEEGGEEDAPHEDPPPDERADEQAGRP